VFESLSTTYFVQATGIPRPTATWIKDGVALSASDRVVITEEGDTYRLEVKDLVMADSGVYKCKITNRLGEVSQEAKLDLTGKHLFLSICIFQLNASRMSLGVKHPRRPILDYVL